MEIMLMSIQESIFPGAFRTKLSPGFADKKNLLSLIGKYPKIFFYFNNTKIILHA